MVNRTNQKTKKKGILTIKEKKGEEKEKDGDVFVKEFLLGGHKARALVRYCVCVVVSAPIGGFFLLIFF